MYTCYSYVGLNLKYTHTQIHTRTYIHAHGYTYVHAGLRERYVGEHVLATAIF